MDFILKHENYTSIFLPDSLGKFLVCLLNISFSESHWLTTNYMSDVRML